MQSSRTQKKNTRIDGGSKDAGLVPARINNEVVQSKPIHVEIKILKVGKDPMAEVEKLRDKQIQKQEHKTSMTDAERAANVEELLCLATQARIPELASHIMGQMSGAMVAHSFKDVGERTLCAIAAMLELKSGNLAESMLAVQMTGVHFAALKFLKDAAIQEQTFEGQDANVLRATRLMRIFNEQLEAMAKLKGKTGQQKVTVEHVHVNAGGQAIVGAVTAGRKESGATNESR
jgi:hypothetical protein